MSQAKREILQEVAAILAHLVLPSYEELLALTGQEAPAAAEPSPAT